MKNLALSMFVGSAALVSAQTAPPAWNPTAEKFDGGNAANMRRADVPNLRRQNDGEKKAVAPAVGLLPGKTLINAGPTSGLRRDLIKGIMGAETQQGAKDSKIVDTKLLTTPKDVSDLAAVSWTEEWTVQRAGGKKAVYAIAFTGQGKGKSISYKVAMKG